MSFLTVMLQNYIEELYDKGRFNKDQFVNTYDFAKRLSSENSMKNTADKQNIPTALSEHLNILEQNTEKTNLEYLENLKSMNMQSQPLEPLSEDKRAAMAYLTMGQDYPIPDKKSISDEFDFEEFLEERKLPAKMFG